MLSHDDLDRLVENCGDAVIKKSMYCARCGYNLRLLPYRHNCPECGNRYHARAIRRKGIFLDDESHLPISEIFFCILSGLFGVGLFFMSIGQWSTLGVRTQSLIFGLILISLIASFIYARLAWPIFIEYRSRHQVIKRVSAQRREEAMHD